MATSEKKNPSDLSEQAIALAEQLGRIAGTLGGTAESWLNRQDLSDQLTRVRDGAAEMLESLADGAERGRSAANAATGSAQRIAAEVRRKASQTLSVVRKSKPAKTKAPRAAVRAADPARAPGKQRRKPGPSVRGLKKSDEKIPKLRSAAEVRQRRKSHA